MNPRFPLAAARLSASAALALLLLVLPLASRAQTSGVSLNGETLRAQGTNPSAFNVTSVNCVPDGVSSFSYTSQGTALGPYPGTYTESGTVTFQNNLVGPSRPVLSFSASYTINSGSTVITGTKELSAPTALTPPNSAACQSLQNGNLTIDTVLANFSATYTANIQTASGSFVDQGTSRVVGDSRRAYTTADPTNTTGQFYSFNETYRNVAQITNVTLTPAAATNPVGSNHTVTATATNASGAGVAGAFVYFDVTADGSTVLTARFLTNASGQASLTYQGPEWPRSDTIRACVDRNDNGQIDPTDPCGTATKEWVFPASTPGASTGGGQLLNFVTQLDGIVLGFNFKSDAEGASGNCTVNDKASDTFVKCQEVLAYVQAGNTATVYGTAEVNGAPTFFKITLEDNDTSGAGADTFSLVTQSGYTVVGVLTQGNIQVHQPQ